MIQGYYHPKENEMDSKMEHEMETGFIQGLLQLRASSCVFHYFRV